MPESYYLITCNSGSLIVYKDCILKVYLVH